ncbi:MAG: hypothetical protein PQJ48_12020 [Sphaerochaetaceae bacterium]|nr:hypothetical protein [uncultured Sphaerochaeta sp.]MDC7231030.1 hypothetical protein [Sphaerochaetaceae bacterium]
MNRYKQILCSGILLLFILQSVFSVQTSLGIELGLPGTTGIVGQFEHQNLRSELALHVFTLEYLRAPLKQEGLQMVEQNQIIGKAIISTKITPTERHVLYGGVGMLSYLDLYDDEYMVGVGPVLQYAWKFPEKHWELNFDFLLPLVFRDTYEEPIPEDDWPSTASFIYVILIAMAPTIGISWSF